MARTLTRKTFLANLPDIAADRPRKIRDRRFAGEAARLGGLARILEPQEQSALGGSAQLPKRLHDTTPPNLCSRARHQASADFGRRAPSSLPKAATTAARARPVLRATTQREDPATRPRQCRRARRRYISPRSAIDTHSPLVTMQ